MKILDPFVYRVGDPPSCAVFRGEEWICEAMTRVMAQNIAEALNAKAARS